MQYFFSLVRFLTRAGAVMAAATVMAMVGHILLEIVLRAVFDTSTYVLDEFVGYGVAASTFLGLGYAMEQGGLIRVNVLLALIRQRVIRQLVELVCVSACFAVFVMVWLNFWKSILRNWERGAVSETIAQVPLWLPEGLLLVGVTIFLLQLVVYALRIVRGEPMIGERTPAVMAE